MTVNTRVIKLFLRRTDMPYVPLPDGLRLQILPDISHLPSCQKHHFAAFIQESTLLVVWDDDPRQILARIKNIESQLMRLIWEDEAPSADEKSVVQESVHPVGSINSSVEDLREPPRKLALMQAILTACTLTILIAAIGSGWRQVAQEIKIDGFMLRLAFAAIVPVQLWLALVRLLDPVVVENTANSFAVFHAIYYRKLSTDDRSNQSDESEHQILFRHPSHSI